MYGGSSRRYHAIFRIWPARLQQRRPRRAAREPVSRQRGSFFEFGRLRARALVASGASHVETHPAGSVLRDVELAGRELERQGAVRILIDIFGAVAHQRNLASYFPGILPVRRVDRELYPLASLLNQRFAVLHLVGAGEASEGRSRRGPAQRSDPIGVCLLEARGIGASIARGEPGLLLRFERGGIGCCRTRGDRKSVV